MISSAQSAEPSAATPSPGTANRLLKGTDFGVRPGTAVVETAEVGWAAFDVGAAARIVTGVVDAATVVGSARDVGSVVGAGATVGGVVVRGTVVGDSRLTVVGGAAFRVVCPPITPGFWVVVWLCSDVFGGSV